MTKGTECLSDGKMAYDNSRIEPKRPHQWFMDGTEAELLPDKKQAVEIPSHNLFSGLVNSNISTWGNASSFHSSIGQHNERIFDPETARTVNFDDRNIPSIATGNINMGRKVIEDPFGSDSSFGLSIAQALEVPRSGVNYGGIKKVKVSQVKDSENLTPVSMGLAYNSTVITPHAYGKAHDNSISRGLSFNTSNDNSISMGHAYDRLDNNFISMGHPYNKGDECTMSMGQPYKDNNYSMSMDQSFRKGDGNIKMVQPFKEDDNNISMGNAFKENNNSISMDQSFSKGDDFIPSTGQTFKKSNNSTTSMGNTYNKMDDNAISMGHTNKAEGSTLSMGHSFGKGEGNIISFGGVQDDDDINSSGGLMCSYDLLMGQSSTQRPEALSEKCFIESNVDTIVGAAKLNSSTSETVSKKKEDPKGSKKVPQNNFPSNVRSLLSTGMLDGVTVKYIAWSREKELRGVIKGSGYLCGCQSCNYSKAINAYEFERHAGCKTKHPNNHIYFDNGKTIYGIVQELRNTPQNLLFDVIQTITGSPINQKSFRLWKGISASTETGKKKILLLKGKEKEIHVSAGVSLQQSAKSVKNSLGSSAFKQNQRREASGRIIKSILLNKDARQSQASSVVQSEQQIQATNLEKDKRPPRPQNVQLLLKDTNGAPEDRGTGNDLHGFSSEKQEKRTRNKDRPDRGVWTPLRRSDGSHASDESLSSFSSQSTQLQHDSAEGSHREVKIDMSNARSGEVRTVGSGRSGYPSLDNGSQKHSSRRGVPHNVRDADGSSSVSEGKPVKRGGSSGFGSHEKQVWVQKSSTGS